MKKFIFLTVALMTMFLTTGCVKYSYNFEIDKKGNLTIAEINALNSKMFKTFDADESELKKQFDNAKKELEKDGYKVENYNDNNFIGLKRSKNYDIKSFEENKLPDGFSSKKLKPFEVKEGFFKNTLDINLSYSCKKAQEKMGEKANSTNTEDMSSFENNTEEPSILSQDKTVDEETGEVTETTTYEDGSIARTKYNPQKVDKIGNALSSLFEENPELKPSADLTIKIPYKTSKHNATKVINKNEYQWDLTSEEVININIKAEKINWNNIIGAIFVLVGIIAGLLIWNRYKETTNW